MDVICASLAALSSALAFLAWSKASDCSLAFQALKKIYKELKRNNECLKKNAVVTIVEAARLLAQDARELYEKTNDEKFLEIAHKWEAFVEANKKAVEKAIYG